MFSALDSTLCDLGKHLHTFFAYFTSFVSNLKQGFIETKCTMGMTFDLVADYIAATLALEALGSKDSIATSLLEFQRFVQARSHVRV